MVNCHYCGSTEVNTVIYNKTTMTERILQLQTLDERPTEYLFDHRHRLCDNCHFRTGRLRCCICARISYPYSLVESTLKIIFAVLIPDHVYSPGDTVCDCCAAIYRKTNSNDQEQKCRCCQRFVKGTTVIQRSICIGDKFYPAQSRLCLACKVHNNKMVSHTFTLSLPSLQDEHTVTSSSSRPSSGREHPPRSSKVLLGPSSGREHPPRPSRLLLGSSSGRIKTKRMLDAVYDEIVNLGKKTTLAPATRNIDAPFLLHFTYNEPASFPLFLPEQVHLPSPPPALIDDPTILATMEELDALFG